MPIGLYLHVPFCASKCPYCDFYSTVSTPLQWEAYTEALCASIEAWGARTNEVADTVYFGGGTPSLLGGKNIARLLATARRAFSVPSTAEITTEANPADNLDAVFSAFASEGGNRVSLGMQTANSTELSALGRRHTPPQVETAVASAKRAGIHNVSLDMMLGIPHQTEKSVIAAAELCRHLEVTHVSAYLLKQEPNTPFYHNPPPLPDEEAVISLYHTAANALEDRGFLQYEISNFSLAGYESRHNVKYWNSEPYIGLGPSAHSFFGGQRFEYPRDTAAFIGGCEPIPEQREPSEIAENSAAEYAMLRLRLTKGLCEEDYRARFGEPLPAVWRKRAAALPPQLVICNENGIRLTREGMLISNAILARIL